MPEQVIVDLIASARIEILMAERMKARGVDGMTDVIAKAKAQIERLEGMLN